jgi:alpha-tubulin suppressor-like RCC1 family protein
MARRIIGGLTMSKNKKGFSLAALLLAPLLAASSASPSAVSLSATRLMAKSVSAGFGNTCAVTLSDGAKCWGVNDAGQLGDGTTSNRDSPVDVAGLAVGMMGISMADRFTCGLTAAGGVKCWGDNEHFALGNSSFANPTSNVPVDVTGLSTGVTAIAAGEYHACALTAAGGVKCWGDNGSGQLGSWAYLFGKDPGDVLDLSSGVKAIASGETHSCALMKTGAVKCWGNNDNGRLGNDYTADRPHPPTGVQGLSSGVTAITAGDGHTCALTDTGTVKCWGKNDYGQLGDGTNTDRPVPVDVVGLHGTATAIAAGGETTCALMDTGGVMCWGLNLAYQSKDDVVSVLSPVAITGLASGVTAIAVGMDHACALMTDGAVKCWGDNSNGELGVGTHTNSFWPAIFPPVEVMDPEG